MVRFLIFEQNNIKYTLAIHGFDMHRGFTQVH